MIRKVAGILLGLILFALFAGWGCSRPAARSPGVKPSALGAACNSAGECESGLLCRKGVCAEDPVQKAIDDAEDQGQQYGR